MPAPSTPPTVGDILDRIGCPLVEMAADEPVESIARLLAFSGLDAVLLVRPCGKAERIVSIRDLIGSFSGHRKSDAMAPELLRCGPDDSIFCVARSMFHCDHAAMLVEKDGRKLAIITVDNLARYLMTVDGASDQ